MNLELPIMEADSTTRQTQKSGGREAVMVRPYSQAPASSAGAVAASNLHARSG